jgi:hypothetical protein
MSPDLSMVLQWVFIQFWIPGVILTTVMYMRANTVSQTWGSIPTQAIGIVFLWPLLWMYAIYSMIKNMKTPKK